MTRTLVVWCPDWPVVASGCEPGLPVAVLEAGRVLAASAAARAEGVGRGLRRRQAEVRCPGLVVVDADPARDARAFEPVVAAVEAFTPAVEILRPGVCALATRGPSRYFGGDAALAAQVAGAVGAVLAPGAPPCRVGVADGRFAAERAARAGRIVPPGHSAGFLAGFPVATLEDPELVDLLARLGIRTLGQLAALPPEAVLARFGTAGATAARLARGLDERPLAARIPPPDLAVTAELDPPEERLETAAFVAKSLADRLAQALAGRGLAATRVVVEAEWEHGERLARCWRLEGAGRTAAALADRVRWQLDGWLTAGGYATRPSGGLVLLRLTPDEVRPDDGRQPGFWGGDRAGAERAARALARVQAMLGPESVVTAVSAGGRGPGDQVRLVPWGEDRSGYSNAPKTHRSRAENDPPWPGRIPPPAPATVHTPPVPAEVVEVDGVPRRVAVAGGPASEVTAWAGPWPVDERWWDRRVHRRRARWQVVTAAGAAHLLSAAGGRWQVEATYD